MKHLLRSLACTLLLACPWAGWAAVNCSLIPNPGAAKGIYSNFFGNVDIQGAFDVTCTRASAADNRRPDLWIGVDQPAGGNTATLDTGGSQLTYSIAHGGYASGVWLNTGAGVAPTSTTNGAVIDTTPDFGTAGMAFTRTYTYYLRVSWLQMILKTAGVYVDSVPLQIRLDGPTGTLLDTATLDVMISLPKNCRFSTPPTAINVNYPAFSPTAVTGRSDFALTCTQGTTYTLTLDATRSVIPSVNLAYGLSITAASGTGTAQAQGYSVNISVDANQAGQCAASTCTGTDIRTITVNY